MRYRGRPRGTPSTDLPPSVFVAFIQNHDQVGNREFGDRVTQFVPAEAVRAIAAVCLLLPQIPMLFMGDEWGAPQPFPFFCDFAPELAAAVREGRRNEFSRFPEFQEPEALERIPDPMAEETFASAKLHWEDIAQSPHARWCDFYSRVLATRHSEIVPRLTAIRAAGRYDVLADGAVIVRWHLSGGMTLVLAANLTGARTRIFPSVSGRVFWQEGEIAPDRSFGSWTVRWSIDEPPSDDIPQILPAEDNLGNGDETEEHV